MGVNWGSPGIHFSCNGTSFGGRLLIILGSFGGHLVVIWASTVDHMGFMFASLGGHLAVIGWSFGHQLGITWGEIGVSETIFSILFEKNVIQAHWTSGIFHEVGVANIPRELNQVFLATGFQMPVTEFFVKQYARAYEHWLQDGDPEKTKDFCYESKDLQNSYAFHISKHGSKAMYKAHTQHVEDLNVQPLPVGRVHEEID